MRKSSQKPIARRHDLFFKSIYSRLKEVKAFLQGMLNPKQKARIKWESLRLDPTSYVTEKLKEYISDLVYWADLVDGRKGGIVFLFEHKSGNTGMPLRLQIEAYLIQIRLAHYQKNKTIPLIIPIIFYHGKVPLRLDSYAALLNPEHYRHFEEYLPPDQKLLVVDLNQYTDEELLERFPRDTVGRLCVLMKHIFDPDLEHKAHEYLGNLESWVDDPERREIIKSMFVYLKEEYKKRKLPMEALKITARQTGLTHDPMDVFMMEYIEQGREQGREEGEVIGEARGETKKALQMAKSMKAKGYPMEEIAELTGLSVEQIKAL